jgi:hypothetical protein
MSEEDLISKLITRLESKMDDASINYASSKYKEWSQLMGEFKKEITIVKTDLSRFSTTIESVELAVKKLDENFREHQILIAGKMPTWDNATNNQSWAVRIVFGLIITALMGLIIIK